MLSFLSCACVSARPAGWARGALGTPTPERAADPPQPCAHNRGAPCPHPSFPSGAHSLPSTRCHAGNPLLPPLLHPSLRCQVLGGATNVGPHSGHHSAPPNSALTVPRQWPGSAVQGISLPHGVFPCRWGISLQSGVFPRWLPCLGWLPAGSAPSRQSSGTWGDILGCRGVGAELSRRVPLRRAPSRSCTPPAPPSRRCGGARASRCPITSTPSSSR